MPEFDKFIKKKNSNSLLHTALEESQANCSVSSLSIRFQSAALVTASLQSSGDSKPGTQGSEENRTKALGLPICWMAAWRILIPPGNHKNL